MTVTLKHGLLYTALTAISIGGLFAGPPIAYIGCVVYPIIIVCFIVNAVFSTAESRCFAVSFLIPAMGYLLLTSQYSPMEYTDGYGRLPTSLFFDWVQRLGSDGTPQSGMEAMNAHDRSLSVIPLGHLSVACFLGYCFGYYGVWTRRRGESTSR